VPYFCGSWRCPKCCRHEAAVTFARLKQAFGEVEYAGGFVFVVLTLDREGYYSGKPWRDAESAYRALGSMSERLLKRLRRRWGFGSEWVAVVEAHRSGWPHMNLLICCPALATYLETERRAALARGLNQRQARLLRGSILGHATACGWGPQSTAERVRDRDAMAGYVTKLAAHAEATAGEVAKITQAPLTAPIRFRRLRSGVGFLPPRRINPEWTGTLVRRQREWDGTVTVLPLHRVAADVLPHVVAVCSAEENLAHAELARAAGHPFSTPLDNVLRL